MIDSRASGERVSLRRSPHTRAVLPGRKARSPSGSLPAGFP